MKRTWRIGLSAATFILFFASCSKEAKNENSSADKDAAKAKAVPLTEPKDKAESEKPAAHEKTDSDANKDDQESDAGTDGAKAMAVDPPTPEEINELVVLLRKRSKEIDLRERELIEREQLISGLESAAMKQVDILRKLKEEVAGMMGKLGKGFEKERKAFEEKQQKEEALRIQKEKEAAEIAEKKTAELKKAANELAEEREQRTVQLTAAVKGMRASSGAEMLASMDEADAVAVLRQLGARQAAALYGNMPSAKAAALAEAMLGPKSVPIDARAQETAPLPAAAPEPLPTGEKPQ